MYHAISLFADRQALLADPPSVWTCDEVITLVANAKNVPLQIIKHTSRCRVNAARARQLAMYLCHVMLGQSLAEVGAAFGRDRTTVSYACRIIEDLRDDPRFDGEVCELERLIEAHHG